MNLQVPVFSASFLHMSIKYKYSANDTIKIKKATREIYYVLIYLINLLMQSKIENKKSAVMTVKNDIGNINLQQLIGNRKERILIVHYLIDIVRNGLSRTLK